MAKNSSGCLVLRIARLDDAEAVLEWRNEKEAIAKSQTGAAVEWKSHFRWFQRTLVSPDTRLFIAEDKCGSKSERIGMCRFEHEGGGIFSVSINVAPLARGQGWGRQLLEQGMSTFHEISPDCRELRAVIHERNVRSQRIFEGCGFSLTARIDEWIYMRFTYPPLQTLSSIS